MRTADFEFFLPPELIAQHPAEVRDASRLMVLHRDSGRVEHRRFRELPQLLQRGDLLVHNDSRVIPARLFGRNRQTGGLFEIFLLEENAANDWWAMLKPGRRARVGTEIQVLHDGTPSAVRARVLETNLEGHRRLRFEGEGLRDLRDELSRLGNVPLPPYIARAAEAMDRQRYQTVYAAEPGSLAAPTAGLHFTEDLMSELRAAGILSHFVTLHVGLGTFAPVKVDELSKHVMHEEPYEITVGSAAAVNAAKAEGRRVVAVGTTSLRVLETVAHEAAGPIQAAQGRTRIFIHPPCRFRVVDALLTNFHLPRSTLLMLVSAFAAPGSLSGREQILAAYQEAIRERYRFFSYGDAMLIL